jgi:hypothetical protein
MSKLGHHNYAKRAAVTDSVIRGALLRRTDELFHEELGDEPLTKERAYELGTEGGVIEFVRRHPGKWGTYRQWVTPAMPADAIRAFDAGLAIDDLEREHRYNDYDNGYDDGPDWMDDRHMELSPADHIWWAWFTVEEEKAIEVERMWEFHEQGWAIPPQWVSLVERWPAGAGVWS